MNGSVSKWLLNSHTLKLTTTNFTRKYWVTYVRALKWTYSRGRSLGGLGGSMFLHVKELTLRQERQEEDLWVRKQNTFRKQKVEKIWRNGISSYNTLEVSHLFSEEFPRYFSSSLLCNFTFYHLFYLCYKCYNILLVVPSTSPLSPWCFIWILLFRNASWVLYLGHFEFFTRSIIGIVMCTVTVCSWVKWNICRIVEEIAHTNTIE